MEFYFLHINKMLFVFLQNNGPDDIVRVPFGTTADTIKMHFTAVKANCKMSIVISIIGCFQSASKC